MGPRPIPLEPGYRAEFVGLTREYWNDLLGRFSDTSIYQTWDYDAVRCGERNLSHLLLRRNDEIVALAQARLARIPGLGWGAAYVRWGPIWESRERPSDSSDFRMAVRALRNEYVCRRKMVLRLFPLAFGDGNSAEAGILSSEHYLPAPQEKPQQTLLLNLEPSLSDLRKGFHQKWRNCLNHAERNSLVITHGTTDNLFADFLPLYRQLIVRKGFKEPNDINEFRSIQQRLPAPLKMGIFLCAENGSLTGGAICSAVGHTGVYLFGATNDAGLKNKGTYLLQWHVLHWLKERACKQYNLNGINPVTNPGTYHFKSGLAGKAGHEVHYLGRFDCYRGLGAATLAPIGLRLIPIVKRALELPFQLNRSFHRRS